ncbi:MAG TPA: AgmX/PglI C-terminal domain-containing protein, partial [Polyangiaceae bacterium]
MRLSSSRALAGAVASFVSFAAIAAVTACGGGAAQSSGAASPASAASGAAAAGDGGAPGASPASAPSSATTTTLTLGDAGDLQGTKLQSASGGSSAFDAPDAGPERGAHGGEPGRSVKDIQTIVQSHRDEARACYDRVQQAHSDPTLKGNLDVKWTIDPTGKVTEIAVDDSRSDIHDAAIGKCVMDVIKGIHFSVSGKGFETRAHYPFNFNPHNVHAPG